MKTVIIWTKTTNYAPQFIVLEGDQRKFDGVYISYREMKYNELANRIYDYETGENLVTYLDRFPIEEVLNGAYVITAGFIN